jgi:hypothetical protein
VSSPPSLDLCAHRHPALARGCYRYSGVRQELAVRPCVPPSAGKKAPKDIKASPPGATLLGSFEYDASGPPTQASAGRAELRRESMHVMVT